METGFLLDSTEAVTGGRGRPAVWVEGEQIGHVVKIRPEDPGQIEVDAYRCVRCGFLELYAGMSEGD